MGKQKIIFVTGGVMSGIGKGNTLASIAKLFQFRNKSVSLVKVDPYLNVDCGTMNPFEHGENFVCESVWNFEPVEGKSYKIAEIDQDFGTYERIVGHNVHPSHNITGGQIWLSVVLKEREGEFLGRTVQMIPHVTEEIKRRILEVVEEGRDVTLVEVGGTVGDIEASIFLESIRQLRNELPKKDTVLVHVSYIPYLPTVRQQKTKPTQHSFQQLLEAGLVPDVVVGRAREELSPSTVRKLSLFGGIPEKAVVSNPNLDVVYELPLVFERQSLGSFLMKKLALDAESELNEETFNRWRQMVKRCKEAKETVRIAMVGKYTKIKDAYYSIFEALKHAASHNEWKADITYVAARNVENTDFSRFDGTLLTPGFGERDTEGMIEAAQIAMQNEFPFLGICFGAQLGTVAFARDRMGWEDANSTEIDPDTPFPVIDLLEEQKEVKKMGGTMRLGGITIDLFEGTKMRDIYGERQVVERFRHRYHIIPKYVEKMKRKGYVVNSVDQKGKIAGFELAEHPFFIGTQAHPEFKSRPFDPSPLYNAFVKAAKRLSS
ncbi:MAG: CTP synthase [Candidatus Korarchaeota archaeon]|nr:CTP synthase [Candidatus Korarchaeota archaeon]NIU83896.1 CTP synthase [Candidatus Thorarchaeota archaeon]NIW14039.1 CTP synthase [Candidatus Thorarchaeota archaeon]NIW51728.1 CTP synthase [Candidatus Korarchaeota archaeon]